MIWKATSALTYESGDFGTGHTTATAYVPFTIHRYKDRWDLSMTVPYLYQKTNRGIAAKGGRAFHLRNATVNRQFSSGGAGDMLMKARYEFFGEDLWLFALAGWAQVKLPTADRTQGLGTGEFDEEIGFEVHKDILRRWTLLGDMSYSHIGSPPGTDLNDQIGFDAGVGYALTSSTDLFVVYGYQTTPLTGTAPPQELSVKAIRAFGPTLDLSGQVTKGLSDGSPDIGLSLGVGLRF